MRITATAISAWDNLDIVYIGAWIKVYFLVQLTVIQEVKFAAL